MSVNAYLKKIFKRKEISKDRLQLVDALRGIAIVNMVLFHLLYDIFCVYEVNPDIVDSMPFCIWERFICITFIVVSGFTWSLSAKSNIKRGIELNIFGFLITLATVLIIPSETIWFGILNFFGCAILIVCALNGLLKKVKPEVGIVVCMILFILFYEVSDGYIGFGPLFKTKVPEILYDIKVLTPLGFPFKGFYSSDFFPIFPWIFMFILGYHMYEIYQKHPKFEKIAKIKIPFLSVIGRYSIWIYMLHQPICMLLCIIASSIGLLK